MIPLIFWCVALWILLGSLLSTFTVKEDDDNDILAAHIVFWPIFLTLFFVKALIWLGKMIFCGLYKGVKRELK